MWYLVWNVENSIIQSPIFMQGWFLMKRTYVLGPLWQRQKHKHVTYNFYLSLVATILLYNILLSFFLQIYVLKVCIPLLCYTLNIYITIHTYQSIVVYINLNLSYAEVIVCRLFACAGCKQRVSWQQCEWYIRERCFSVLKAAKRSCIKKNFPPLYFILQFFFPS